MGNYLETIYFRNETDEQDYPQKLCDHIIKNFIDSKFKDILDVGSGKGNHLIGFARRGFNIKGIDYKPECLNALADFDIRDCNLEKDKLPFEDNSFDVIFSKSVIEHVSNADNLFDEIYRVLRKGGIAIIMTPDWNTQCHYFWDDYTHVKAWTRKSLQNIMRMKNFKQVECILFRQIPILWKCPWLKFIFDLIALLPNSLKWKDKKEEIHRPLIRFSKEKMLLAIGVK